MNDKDDARKAQEWVEREGLPFTVLMDTDWRVGVDYGMSEHGGERYLANPADGRRPAVVIDEDGRIAAWEPDMNDAAQVGELLARL